MKKNTKLQVLRFYDKYIAANAPCRHKLCVHVVAKQHEENPEEGASTPEEVQKEKSKAGAEKTVRIDDPVEFRQSMPQFAMPAKTVVKVVDLGINTNKVE